MEDILKLIDITKKKGQRSIQLVNQNFRKKEISKDNLLYEGIIGGKFDNDEVAAKKIFRADPGNRNYRNAKRKLHQKLLNHLYFLDYEKEIYSEYDKYNYECLHQLHQCKVLIAEEASEVALKILPGLIKTAIDYECVDIAVEAITLIRNEYAQLGKTTPYEEFSKLLNKQKKYQEAVHTCESLYYNIIVQINKSVSAHLRVLPKVPQAIASINQYANKYKSARLDVLSHKLQLRYNNITNNYQANIKLCGYLEKKYLHVDHIAVKVDLDKKKITFNKLYAYFCLKEVDKGHAYAEKSIKLFKSGSTEWFNFCEYHFLLLMKGELFKKAIEVYRKVRTNKNYSFLDEEEKDRWQIYRAYLIFFKDIKLLKWGFDIEHFLHARPTYGKNLQGYNTATLIIQFLYLLRDGKTEEIEKRIQDLQPFNSVHLDKRNNYRTSIFIRLLSIVIEKEFNAKAVKEKGNTYFKKLLNTQIPTDLRMEMEIIPYEILWKNILEILMNNKTFVHFRFYNTLQSTE